MDYHMGLLRPSEETSTLSRLQTLLQNAKYARKVDATKPRCEFQTNYFEIEYTDDGYKYFDIETSKSRARKVCEELCGFNAIRPLNVDELDSVLSKIFKFQFEPLDKTKIITERAFALLSRMPAFAPELDDAAMIRSVQGGTGTGSSTVVSSTTPWTKLPVSQYMSDTVLKVALSMITDPGGAEGLVKALTNILATLLEITTKFGCPKYQDQASRWFFARAFLWACWQRCQLLYLHQQAKADVVRGAMENKDGRGSINLRDTTPIPGTTIHEWSRQVASQDKSPYMCGWNFELLRSHPACIGADFRRFHKLYSNAFSHVSGRCIPGQPQSCEGDSPKNCQRFEGMVIKDQSQHDRSCSGSCKTLFWSEKSYRSIKGARAVSVKQPNIQLGDELQYCNAGDTTLAISHVWSHGQGGRPHTGINACLHQRYCEVAVLSGCDSYWIDAICIPDNHQLRAEAITYINDIFRKARVMLVCDRDIMQIDASNLSIQVCETLLVAAIVSDWNTRAWTFLEAFQGRRQTHVLCKDNKAVSMSEVIKQINRVGALDIQISLLTVPHFMPPIDDTKMMSSLNGGRKAFEANHMRVETSGSLLSHRPASRPGDDIVIWSLLVGSKKVHSKAEDWWKSMRGEMFLPSADGSYYHSAAHLDVGIILSNAPRLKERGLRWAPTSPTHLPAALRQVNVDIQFDHGVSYMASVTEDGLVGSWYVWTFKTALPMHPTSGPQGLPQTNSNLYNIKQRFLKGYKWGAILRPLGEESLGPNVQSPKDAFLSMWQEGGRARHVVVIVCATNDPDGTVKSKYEKMPEPGSPRNLKWAKNEDVIGWEWRGVYQWDVSEPFPDWRLVKQFLID